MKFKILPTFVGDILRKFRFGLQSGLGNGGDGHMCVQHVVSRALGEGRTDNPTCVKQSVTGYGIALNDAPGWSSHKARAEGLKRFAVAQLGTSSDDYVFDDEEWSRRIRMVWQNPKEGYWDDDSLTAMANRLADILIDMKTPGAEHICMLEWSEEDLIAMEKEHNERMRKNPRYLKD